MLLNVTELGVALRAGLSAAPEPRQGRVSAIRLQSHNARGGGGHFAGSSHPVGEAVSGAGHCRHGSPMMTLGFPSASTGGADQRQKARIIRLARECVSPRKRFSGHTEHASTGEGQTKPRWYHTNLALTLRVRVERTAPKATGAASPIPARRRTAAIAVFPRFPETGAPFASSIGTV